VGIISKSEHALIQWFNACRVQKETAAQDALKKALSTLDAYLQSHTFLVGDTVTLADVITFANLWLGYTKVDVCSMWCSSIFLPCMHSGGKLSRTCLCAHQTNPEQQATGYAKLWRP